MNIHNYLQGCLRTWIGNNRLIRAILGLVGEVGKLQKNIKNI